MRDDTIITLPVIQHEGVDLFKLASVLPECREQDCKFFLLQPQTGNVL